MPAMVGFFIFGIVTVLSPISSRSLVAGSRPTRHRSTYPDTLCTVVIALIVVAAIAIVVIAFYSVGHAVGVTEQMPAQIVVDVHEAIEFCAEALPDYVTATVSYDELRRVLRLHLEWIQFYHWAPETAASGPIVFEQFDALDYVMERVSVTNLEISRENAEAVIQAHSDYLQVMGAIHLDDPVKVEQDLAEMPLLENPAGIELGPGEIDGLDHADG